VADLKITDGAYLETEMAARAGADMVVVMGVAHPATVRATVRAAQKHGIKVMGDIMAAPDKVACARMLEENGCDYIIVHTGYDERHEETSLSPFDDLQAVVEAVSVPVQAVGGLSIEQAVQMPKRGAPLVVIGAPLAIDDAAFQAAGGDVEAVLREVVRRVKGIEEPRKGIASIVEQAGGAVAAALRRAARRIEGKEE
jgi:3-hexulose-6-phosphate synthase